MRIFRFESGNSSKFAYASGYYPFGNMAFVEGIPEGIRNMMNGSGKLPPKMDGQMFPSSELESRK
jgi:hypothetical protein